MISQEVCVEIDVSTLKQQIEQTKVEIFELLDKWNRLEDELRATLEKCRTGEGEFGEQ